MIIGLVILIPESLVFHFAQIRCIRPFQLDNGLYRVVVDNGAVRLLAVLHVFVFRCKVKARLRIFHVTQYRYKQIYQKLALMLFFLAGPNVLLNFRIMKVRFKAFLSSRDLGLVSALQVFLQDSILKKRH